MNRCKPRKQTTLKTDEEGNEIKVEPTPSSKPEIPSTAYLILAIHAAQRQLTGY